jgi:hypothetical protein
MRPKVVTLAVCLFCPLLAARPASGVATVRSDALPWCVSTTDSVAQRLVAQLTQLASSTGSDWVTMRDPLAHMPMSPASEIAMIGDEALCQHASQLLDSVFFASPEAQAVYLVKVGERYAVYPPRHLMQATSWASSLTSSGSTVHSNEWRRWRGDSCAEGGSRMQQREQ